MDAEFAPYDLKTVNSARHKSVGWRPQNKDVDERSDAWLNRPYQESKSHRSIASLSANHLPAERLIKRCLLGVSYGLEAFSHRSGKLLGGRI
jgi:hypothetical protein